ncbi:AsmA family protein [Muriicola sp. Z0-33]|uniref:AsmA family protein n=1 Tax=Muriicola sp. Z0-33 TaxID=2816957 RepID=UPI0022379879|nr:AsmA family protein [Muriicola sp. Z0-33]MCW5516146.1 AsmA family protein [Muriicola sp. Z0-33]
MKKKIIKVIAVVVLLFAGLLIALPFFLEAKIGDIIKSNVNNNVNATLDFEDANLSLISSFPNAELDLKNVTLLNHAPFQGDTLFAGKELSLTMGLGELFKGEDDPIAIKNLTISGANIRIIVSKDEEANYEIAKDDGTSGTTTGVSQSFSFDLQTYALSKSKVIYHDRAAEIYLEVADIEHTGKGDLSANSSELDTDTEALVTFKLNNTNYLRKNKIKLNALIGIDLINDKYTFLKNEALINQLPLVFDGFVKVNENNQEVDISFKTPSSDFKNFLAVIPAEYSKNIENVETSGNFIVEGQFTGVVDEEHIPKFNVRINSDNASFKYPDLPKTVSGIYLDVGINNSTGLAEQTYIDINKASFNIDKDKFNLRSRITELLGNTRVDAHLDGNLDLANISNAYPIATDLDLKGRLKADISTVFDMAAIENKQYSNTSTSGDLDVRGFEYSSEEFAKPIRIEVMAMSFNSGTVNLTELKGGTGTTDFNANGKINNLLGFLFNNEDVQGDFELTSNTFSLNDFMDDEVTAVSDEQASASKEGTTQERLKIPSFLDVNINALANTVLYDNLVLKDVRGNLRIKDEKAVLSNMSSSLFDGRLTFEGEVSTKGVQPVFDMQLGMQEFKIGETFKALELFEVLAPIANMLKGKMNSTVSLSGTLQDDFTPDLQNISGNVLAEVLATNISPQRAEMLSALSSKLSFLKTEKLNLQGLKTALSFEDGMVKVKPFTIHYEDIAIKVNGEHSFDQKLNYTATMDVPTKYLGQEVNNLIAKIDEEQLADLTIPVVANIGGKYAAPEVSTDLSSGIKNLTTQLVEIQKQKLINQGKDKASELIGGILSSEKKTDSAAGNNNSKDGIADVVGGILGANAKKPDTVQGDTATAENDIVKEKAKDIIGGLFGKKKKDTAASKNDTIKE